MRGFFLCVFSLVACVSTATAGDGWYASIYGGLNRDQVIDLDFVKSKDGLLIGGTIGHKVAGIPGLRVEADASYRTNDVDVFDCLTVRHETTAIMGNAVFDIGSGQFVPYVLAGAGYAETRASVADIPGLSLEASDVAYQLGGGVNVTITSGVSAGVGYRFLQAPELNAYGEKLSDGKNHSAVASLSFDL